MLSSSMGWKTIFDLIFYSLAKSIILYTVIVDHWKFFQEVAKKG